MEGAFAGISSDRVGYFARDDFTHLGQGADLYRRMG